MGVMPGVPREVLDYYESGREFGRLTDGSLAGPLEYERTIELLQRYVPVGADHVLDVGGGPGTYANWLAQRGHSVRLVDPVGRHVEAARSLGLDAELGEAQRLEQADSSFDVVLLMGPLYHLVDEPDRLQALREAWRVLKPGGVLVATAISRFAALFDQLIRLDRYHEPDELARIETIVGTGVLPARPGGVFTTAFLHLPRQLGQELTSAGFVDVDVVGIEGPGYLVSNFDERWADDGRRAALIGAARLVEHDPEIVALGSHLMAVGRRSRPGTGGPSGSWIPPPPR
jgi:SAM-dependent methyltransferase